ncbi:replicative DNA helicase [Psychrobacter sp.]|uniref:replicative DNA helicase n=1 Tax=Psychrobacter sp. TaxID=56811 RepID=UPI00356997EB
MKTTLTPKPNYSVSLEKSVLASLMSIENSYESVAEIIGTDDFVVARHKTLFNTITYLHKAGMPIDVVMVTDHLAENKNIEAAGGDSYIAEMMSQSPATLFNLIAHAEKIKAYSQIRATVSLLTDSTAAISNDADKDLESQINDIVSGLNQITEEKQKSIGPQSVTDMMGRFFEKLGEKAKSGITPFVPTGFFDLDIRAPVQPGDLVVVGARPSMGKTIFVLNILDSIVGSTGKAGVLFSMEMDKDSMMNRFMSQRTGVPLHKYISGQGINEDEWAASMKAVTALGDGYPLIMDDRQQLTHTQVRSTLQRMRASGQEIGTVAIDYLGIMGGINPDNKINSIAEITVNLKMIAREFNCPIILLSQLNRTLENRPNKRPINSDLRDSGTIEQDADVIMFLYRDEVYNENSEQKGVAEVIIGKNRQGEIGTVRLGFDGSKSRFSNFMPTADDC